MIAGSVRAALGMAARWPAMQGAMLAIHGRLVRDRPWNRPHPFDRALGTDTGGFIPPWLLPSGLEADRHSTCFAGCQPSCVRAALAAIPAPEQASFIDLGCGKGRALVVASERPFRAILGVELSGHLAHIARANAARIAATHPGRTRIQVLQGDATTAALPDGPRVVFLYHAFGRDLVTRIATRLAAEAAGHPTFYVYENPVHGDILDAIPAFSRHFAATISCDPAEHGFAPDAEDAVVIWRTPPAASHPAAGRRIVVTKPEWRAELRG